MVKFKDIIVVVNTEGSVSDIGIFLEVFFESFKVFLFGDIL